METLIIHPTKDQEKVIIDFLETLKVPFEKIQGTLPKHVLEGIDQGRQNALNGQTISFDELKQRRSLSK